MRDDSQEGIGGGGDDGGRQKGIGELSSGANEKKHQTMDNVDPVVAVLN